MCYVIITYNYFIWINLCTWFWIRQNTFYTDVFVVVYKHLIVLIETNANKQHFLNVLPQKTISQGVGIPFITMSDAVIRRTATGNILSRLISQLFLNYIIKTATWFLCKNFVSLQLLLKVLVCWYLNTKYSLLIL